MPILASAIQLHFCNATNDNVSDIVTLVEDAYRGTKGWTHADIVGGQRTDKHLVAEAISKSDQRILVAFVSVSGTKEKKLVACCHLIHRDCEVAWFDKLAVDPEMQGNGIGQRMLVEAEHFARLEWGCARVEMEVVHVQTELIAWYQRWGYCLTGISRQFPDNNPRFGVPRRQNLRLELLSKLL